MGTNEWIEFWKNQTGLESGTAFAIERELDLTLARLGSDANQRLKKAIENYAKIISSDEHFYKHKHTLEKFLKNSITQFLDSMTPLENFKKPELKNSANSVKENNEKAGNAWLEKQLAANQKGGSNA